MRRYENNRFQGCPVFFLYSLKHFGDTYGVRGSRFGNIFDRCKDVPKHIAIDQESLIGHFGINPPPKKNNYMKNHKKNRLFCRILGPIKPRCWPF